MKKIIPIFLAVALLSSCYKIFSVVVPDRVEAGQTFEVSFTIVDDGSNTQNFKKDWSYAAVRVPEGWTVTVLEGAHEQFAADWVYYEDGSKVASRHDMRKSDKYTTFCQSVSSRRGYQWHGFESNGTIPKNISACWRNGCDSIRVTFLVTVPADAAPGQYAIDFIGGDEEDAAGVEKYADFASTKDSRLYHAATVNGTYVENKSTDLSRTIEVVESAGVATVKAADSSAPAYDLQGRRTKSETKGVVVKDGKKFVRTR